MTEINSLFLSLMALCSFRAVCNYTASCNQTLTITLYNMKNYCIHLLSVTIIFWVVFLVKYLIKDQFDCSVSLCSLLIFIISSLEC